jgi:hypothetical protein
VSTKPDRAMPPRLPLAQRHDPAQSTAATRRGGIGDRLPGGATRLTARRGASPITLPYMAIRNLDALQLLDDIALRIKLGVHPYEDLWMLEHFDSYLARRHQPDYWTRTWGIDLDTIVDPLGPAAVTVISLPSTPGFPTHGLRLLLLRREVRWRDSPVYGLVRYRRGWPTSKITIEGIEHQRNRYDVQMAERGLALARGDAPRGRTPIGRLEELDRLADLARRWARGKPHHTLDDVQWQHLALTDLRSQQTLERAAGKLSIRIEDVRQRAREHPAWAIQLPD